MALLETKVFNRLLGHTGVSVFVDDRVFPVKLPQGCQLPAVTFQRVSSTPDNNLAGYSGVETPAFSSVAGARATRNRNSWLRLSGPQS